MAYLGVEYRDFEGLGRALTKSFNNLSVGTAVFQMLVTIVVILWVALLPQLVLGALGVRAVEGGRPMSRTDRARRPRPLCPRTARSRPFSTTST